jgi:hypothetical protein
VAPLHGSPGETTVPPTSGRPPSRTGTQRARTTAGRTTERSRQ